MQVHNNNNNSQSFGSIKIQMSKMNNVQKEISSSIAEVLKYTPEYLLSRNNGLDVYILPTKKMANEVSIRFIDKGSDCFMREPSNAIVNVRGLKSNSDLWDYHIVDKIRKELVRLCDDSFKRPKFDLDKVAEKRTDVALLNPRSYDDLDLYNGNAETAKTAVDEFMHLKSRFSFDENF